MRILLVANTLPPKDLSGVGEQVLQLEAGLRAAGHEVEVLGRGPGGARGPKVLFPLMIVPAMWRNLRRFRPHVVQVHESDGGLAVLVTKVLRRFLQPRPYLLALLQVSYCEERRAVRPLRYGGRVLGRPGWTEKRFRWIKAPIQVFLGRISARWADGVLAPSQTTAEEIERDYDVSGVRILRNVTGGLDVPAPDHKPGYLLYVGRLRIRKGVEVLLEALRQLDDEGVEARLLVVGDGEQMKSLEQQVRKNGLADRVTFLGRCKAPRVRQLLLGARCLVVPSVYEGMPLVILEAMSEAVPVIASRVSGIPEVVLDGETGWLVPPEDPPALAEALRQAIESPDEARKRGKAGRQRVEENFQPPNAAVQWLTACSSFGFVAPGSVEFGAEDEIHPNTR